MNTDILNLRNRWWIVTAIVCLITSNAILTFAEEYDDDDDDDIEYLENENGEQNDIDEADHDEAEAADQRPKPENFPTVPLVENSVPRYAAVRLDPWNKNVLYLMFDGNRRWGYNRLYVWVPEGRKYDTPTPLEVSHSDNRFPTITWRTEKDNEVVETAYTFSSRRSVGVRSARSARSARTTTSFDYATGKTVTRTRSARSARPARGYTNISLGHNLVYTRDKSPLGGENLMRVSIPGGSISTSTNFASVSPRVLWNNIGFRWSVDRVDDGTSENALLNITGNIRRSDDTIRFSAIPRSFFDINIRVSPYLQDPVFNKAIPVADLMRNGLQVEIPCGWYRAAYDAKTHPWIGGRDISGSMSLRSLGRSRPASSSAAARDRSPASRLRGPPPSQLRGGSGSSQDSGPASQLRGPPPSQLR